MTRTVLTMTILGAAVAGALLTAQDNGSQNNGSREAAGGPGPFGGGPILAALDTSHDGVISTAELAAAPTSLLTLDANHDGQLTESEWRGAFGRGGGRGARGAGGPGARGGEIGPDARGGGEGTTTNDLVNTLMAFDRDASGTLERSEVPQRFQGLFDRADGNKDGVLTGDELRQAAAQPSAGTDAPPDGRAGRGGRFGGGPGGAPLEPLVRALDTNADQVISSSEIAAAPTALKTLDRNGDGQLSRDEITPAFGRRGGRGGDIAQGADR